MPSTRVGKFRFHGEAANEPTEGAGLGTLSLVIVLFAPRYMVKGSPSSLVSEGTNWLALNSWTKIDKLPKGEKIHQDEFKRFYKVDQT